MLHMSLIMNQAQENSMMPTAQVMVIDGNANGKKSDGFTATTATTCGLDSS